MPNPKKRHSKTRRNKRRSHDALSMPALSLCPQCGEPKLPHHICPNCGTYKGREVIKSKELS
ncbi:MAG: 50S ribosomal protein L32 [Deltaproteobacteria bacterium GWC2_42_51]|nr:MAG: 50S ribosomal protein L32 [Bdellovibrionales bacterium RIFOXYB2_FULL_36_6]OGP08788.1 MAG: 50S ribosomal protein L32 [Deltaproteobacteria bacterium GWA2_42_85]OGP25613.1 MAG: 50S ribosomal protein L32 [Deltaproteobacteria bacterium GWB2_42_7]OGP36866.1 MAG: 50S ribosomal protein L32 [Deltaproteobacteria bacterium GWC2_42_51]OGP43967.1 MAG: 50S ribosomal protein L32 [Deltaproteobacteria bacterium GWD2_42_10]OGP48877.1 MAG: 50S ribosomal protein L32 [Deltaproteobacteria bacterium GWF2_42_